MTAREYHIYSFCPGEGLFYSHTETLPMQDIGSGFVSAKAYSVCDTIEAINEVVTKGSRQWIISQILLEYEPQEQQNGSVKDRRITQIHSSSKTNTMNFFEELNKLLTGYKKVTFTVTPKGDQLNIAFLPETGNKKTDDKLLPLSLTGTPAELDAEFFQHIGRLGEAVNGVVSNLETVAKELEGAKKANAEKKTETANANNHAAKPAKKAAGKGDKKAKPAAKAKVEETGDNAKQEQEKDQESLFE